MQIETKSNGQPGYNSQARPQNPFLRNYPSTALGNQNLFLTTNPLIMQRSTLPLAFPLETACPNLRVVDETASLKWRKLAILLMKKRGLFILMTLSIEIGEQLNVYISKAGKSYRAVKTWNNSPHKANSGASMMLAW